MSTDDLAAVRERAEKALRTPDLEWARDLVHGLANDVLRLATRLQEAERERDFAQREWGRVTDQRTAAEAREAALGQERELLIVTIDGLSAQVTALREALNLAAGLLIHKRPGEAQKVIHAALAADDAP